MWTRGFTILASILLVACHEPAPDPNAPDPNAPDPNAPDPNAKPAPRPVDPIPALDADLGKPCDDASPCAGPLVCRASCMDWPMPYIEDECEPVSKRFCDVDAKPRELAPEQFMLVLMADRPFAVIDAIAIERNPFAGRKAKVLAHGPDHFVAGIDAPPELIDDAIRPLAERSYVMFDATERRCTAGASDFVALALEPRQDRLPKLGSQLHGDRLEYASQNGALLLALALEPEGPCEGASWTRAADVPDVGFGPVRRAEPDAAAREQALAHYVDSVPYRITNERLLASGEAEPGARWTEFHRDEPSEWGPEWGVEVFALELLGREHLVVSSLVGHACLGFYGALMHDYVIVDGEPRLAALDWSTALQPRFWVDLDGDGKPELVEHDGVRARMWSSTLTTRSRFAPAAASSGC